MLCMVVISGGKQGQVNWHIFKDIFARIALYLFQNTCGKDSAFDNFSSWKTKKVYWHVIKREIYQFYDVWVSWNWKVQRCSRNLRNFPVPAHFDTRIRCVSSSSTLFFCICIFIWLVTEIKTECFVSLRSLAVCADLVWSKKVWTWCPV